MALYKSVYYYYYYIFGHIMRKSCDSLKMEMIELRRYLIGKMGKRQTSNHMVE